MSQSKKIIVVSAIMEFPLCPTVVVGTTDDGWIIRARYRWGHLSIWLENPNPLPTCITGYWVYNKQIDPLEMDGSMYYDDLREITEEIITWPDELSPRTINPNDDSCPDDLLI